MKHFNEKLEAIITTKISRVNFKEKTKDGDVVPHKEIVKTIKYYVPIYNNNGETIYYQQIFINRNDIMELSEQIKEIESKVFDYEYDAGLPF